MLAITPLATPAASGAGAALWEGVGEDVGGIGVPVAKLLGLVVIVVRLALGKPVLGPVTVEKIVLVRSPLVIVETGTVIVVVLPLVPL